MAGAFTNGTTSSKYWVPLQFWFCRNPGLALPLIALQYHEVIVKLNHKFENGFHAEPTRNKLWADYIYLDTDERRRFAQVSHEYLIEQVQENTIETTSHSKLNFNHPVKELIWVVNATTGVLAAVSSNTDTTYKLQLNGHDRFKARNFRYFTRTQVWQHHTGCGGLNASLAGDGNKNGALNDGIAVYSFALKPEEHQPSGTCNFSRIDDAKIVIGGAASSATKIYAVNYNVLRIMSGMGGLAYSN